MHWPNLKAIALPIPEIKGEFWVELRTPNLGQQEAVGGQGWYCSKERY